MRPMVNVNNIGQWSQTPVAVRLGPIEKAVIRIRQSGRAGQPNAAGFNECPPGQCFSPCTIFGAIFTKNRTIFSAKYYICQKN